MADVSTEEHKSLQFLGTLLLGEKVRLRYSLAQSFQFKKLLSFHFWCLTENLWISFADELPNHNCSFGQCKFCFEYRQVRYLTWKKSQLLNTEH